MDGGSTDTYTGLPQHIKAAIRVLETARPLGRPDEPFGWETELSVAPWAIHVAG